MFPEMRVYWSGPPPRDSARPPMISPEMSISFMLEKTNSDSPKYFALKRLIETQQMMMMTAM